MLLLSPSVISLSPLPRLVLRLSFAGRKELTADPVNGLTTDSPHGAEYRKHGESLLTQFFDCGDSPARQTPCRNLLATEPS